MKTLHNSIVLFIMICVIGCTSRPSVPAGVNNYSKSSSRPATIGNVSTKRPQLPVGQSTRGTVPKATKSNNILTGQEIFKRCNTAVFMIFTSTGYEEYQGSGFFISSNGLAVSNYHVFEGTGMGLETIKLVDNTQLKLDEVIYKDKDNDLMIFTVDLPIGYKCNYIPISNRTPQVGDKAYAIGSPLGLENTFSSGEISQLRDSHIIQISVPIDHGSSGGALINEYGEAIGVTCAGLDNSGANLNFAISTDVIKRFVR